MGNYYEGSLTFRFNKDVDRTLFNDMMILVNKMYDDEDVSDFSEQMRAARWLTHAYHNYPSFHLYELYDCDNIENIWEIGIDREYDDFFGDIQKEQDECYLQELRKHTFLGYCFEVRFCMKHYMWDFDLGEAIVEYFKPYVDISLYNDGNGGYIGHIDDEDSTYFKTFYVDEEHHPVTKARLPICGGCPLEVNSGTCENFWLCERAYNLGKNSNNNTCDCDSKT